MGFANQSLRAGVMAAFGLSALAACVTAQQRIHHREDDLAAAGFVVKPANTPQRQAMLARLPANRFVQRTHGDDVHYIYADPVLCKCLYVGSQQAYGAFKKHEQDQRLADEQQMSAQIYSDTAWQWGLWGPWSPRLGFVYGPRGW
jgi:hypothetical protein